MSRGRIIAVDRARTERVRSGTSPEFYGRVNWLGHQLDKATSQLDRMLLRGTTQEELASVRGAINNHLRHLAKEHGLVVRHQGGRLWLE